MKLSQFQLDLAARLQSAAFFANIPIFVFRPRAALTAADIQDKINNALGALTGQNGRSGLAVSVLMPLLNVKEQDIPGPYPHMVCTVRVQENVMVNMGVAGTLIACEDAATAVAQTLHLWTPGGTAGIVRAAPNALRPSNLFEGRVTYDVNLESEFDLDCLPRTVQPFITEAEGEISIACADPDAAIWYSTDGSAPWAGNGTYPSTSTLYAAPFAAPPAGTLIRAAAFNPGELGSDITWMQL